jgi:hypothetical protein
LLDLEIRKADDLVADLKQLMKPLKTSAADFYNGFIASSKIVNIGAHKIYAQIKLVEDVSGATIPEGTIEVLELGRIVPVSKRGFGRIQMQKQELLFNYRLSLIICSRSLKIL